MPRVFLAGLSASLLDFERALAQREAPKGQDDRLEQIGTHDRVADGFTREAVGVPALGDLERRRVFSEFCVLRPQTLRKRVRPSPCRPLCQGQWAEA